MKKLLLNIFIVFVTTDLCSQNTPAESNSFTPKLTKPSPQAFSFTKYGDIPVGLFTGTMNYSIPLFNLETGKLSLPVSLDYATNGVKVDEVSGRTGMDWNLKTGGLITRNILGKPDESAALMPPSTSDSMSQTFFNYMNFVGENNINTQPDEFTYSFMGLSGKFYFDYSGDLKEIAPSGFKFVTNSNYDYFNITTLDGTQYYFTATDETYNYSYFGGSTAINNSDGGRTAWYLTKIKNVYGDSIELKYSLVSTNQIQYLSGITQTLRSAPNGLFQAPFLLSSNCGTVGMDRWTRTGYYSGCNSNLGTNTDIRFTSMTVMKLTEIHCKQGLLKFYYSGREDLPGEQKLDSIDLFSKIDNKRIETVGFEYLYSQSPPVYDQAGFIFPQGNLPSMFPYLRKRLFLEKLKLYENTKSNYEIYKFGYDDINALPPKLSYAQDLYGYFNGKLNTHFLPSNTIFHHWAYLSSLTDTRDIDSAFTKKGVLTKITYPTGGYSNIIYQTHQLATNPTQKEVVDTIDLDIQPGITGYNLESDTFTLNYPYKIELSAEYVIPPDENTPQLDPTVVFSLQNISVSSCQICDVGVNAPGIRTFVNEIFTLQSGQVYKMKLSCQNPNIKGRVRLIHYKYVQDTSRGHATPGLRVATFKNYTDDNKLATARYFNYNSPNGISSGRSYIQYNDKRDFCYVDRLNCTGNNGGFEGAQFVISSYSGLGSYVNDYATVNYEYVTETFDSSGSGGSITTQFLLGQQSLPTTMACKEPDFVYEHSPFLIYGTPKTNTGYLNGKEFRKTWYKRTGNLSKKVKEITNYFSTDSRLYVVDSFYVIRKAISRPIYSPGVKYFADFDINEYKRISAWVHLDSSIQKDFDEFDREFKTRQAFVYGNSKHLLPTEVTQNTSTGAILKKITKFTDDVRASDLNNPVLNKLSSNHLLAVPLHNLNYLNNSILTTSQIEYNLQLLPSVLKTSKSVGPLETETAYNLYDALGNLQEVNQRGQMQSSITDTTTNHLIASCTNASFNDIAYTSFETNFGGNWEGFNTSRIKHSGGITGNKFYEDAGFVITKPGLDPGKTYILSYWSKNGPYAVTAPFPGYPKSLQSLVRNGETWILYEHLIKNEGELQVLGTGAIDELRLHPISAFMSTYTYFPFIGIHTESDSNNRITYYEYDGFGRLKLIRNEDQNILKVFEYKFSAQ